MIPRDELVCNVGGGSAAVDVDATIGSDELIGNPVPVAVAPLDD